MNKGIWLYLAISVLSGTLLALQFQWGAVVLSLLILSLILRKMPRHVILLSLIFLSVSFTTALLHEKNNHTGLSPGQDLQLYNVELTDIPTIDGDTFVSLARLQDEKVLLRYSFQSEEEKNEFQKLKPGFSCRIKGALKEPKPSRNPNLFDYRSYLSHQGVFWILDAAAVEGCTDNSTWKHTLAHVRFQGMHKIEESFPASTVGVAQALIFGESRSIAEDTMKDFRELGVVHLLAISGLHVGLLFGALYYVLLRIGLAKEAVSWTGVGFLLCYIILTGASPSVIRASGMLIFLLLAKKANRRLTVVDSLSFVFCCIALYRPYSVFNPGFQLSFIVSFSLILSSAGIIQDPSSFRQLCKVTFVAQLSSLPVVLFQFFEFPLIGFITNLIYVPLFSVIILPLSILLFFLSTLTDAAYVFGLYENLLELIFKCSSYLASLPFSTVVFGRPSFLFLLGYLIIIYGAFVGMEKRKTLQAGAYLLLFVLFHQLITDYDPYGEIVFIDVGQGDSTLIRLPYNRGTYLIDAGGEVNFDKEKWQERTKHFSVGEDIIVPFLKSKGITVIDALILTHGDMDHIGGAQAVMDELKVREILISPHSQEKDEMANIIELASSKSIPVREGMYLTSWQGDRNGLHIVSPQDAVYEGNNDSIVLYGRIGPLRWLFTGDLEEEGEREFVDTFDLPVDVLKVGHHGSKTSTTEVFLEDTLPQVGIISAGESNRFGHPHPEVMERLRIRGMTLYNTAEDGAITYRFREKRGTFSAQLP